MQIEFHSEADYSPITRKFRKLVPLKLLDGDRPHKDHENILEFGFRPFDWFTESIADAFDLEERYSLERHDAIHPSTPLIFRVLRRFDLADTAFSTPGFTRTILNLNIRMTRQSRDVIQRLSRESFIK